MKIDKHHEEEITNLVLDYLRANEIILGTETNLQITIRPPVEVKAGGMTDEFLDGDFFEFWEQAKALGGTYSRIRNGALSEYSGVSTVRDFLSKDTFAIAKWREVGRKTLIECSEWLASKGLYLGMIETQK